MVNPNHKYAVGVFTKHQEVEAAINQLKTSGFPIEQVSIIAKDVEPEKPLGEAQVSDRIGEQNVNVTKPVGETLSATTRGSLLDRFIVPKLFYKIKVLKIGVYIVFPMLPREVDSFLVLGNREREKAINWCVLLS